MLNKFSKIIDIEDGHVLYYAQDINQPDGSIKHQLHQIVQEDGIMGDLVVEFKDRDSLDAAIEKVNFEHTEKVVEAFRGFIKQLEESYNGG